MFGCRYLVCGRTTRTFAHDGGTAPLFSSYKARSHCPPLLHFSSYASVAPSVVSRHFIFLAARCRQSYTMMARLRSSARPKHDRINTTRFSTPSFSPLRLHTLHLSSGRTFAGGAGIARHGVPGSRRNRRPRALQRRRGGGRCGKVAALVCAGQRLSRLSFARSLHGGVCGVARSGSVFAYDNVVAAFYQLSAANCLPVADVVLYTHQHTPTPRPH